jgi:membrane-bound inhibitor of C-type lysozyme
MIRILLVCMFAATLGACATVTRGTTNQLQIESEPSGAQVKTSLGQSCNTPCTLTVNRKDEFSVTYSKPGYANETVQVKTQIAGAGAAGLVGNAIVGGVIGIGVDVITGSTLEHTPNPVKAALQPLVQERPKPGSKKKQTPKAVKPVPVEEDEPTPVS